MRLILVFWVHLMLLSIFRPRSFLVLPAIISSKIILFYNWWHSHQICIQFQLSCTSERSMMIFYNSIAVFIPAALFAYLCFVPESMPLLVVCVFGGVQAALGFNCGGYYKCGALVSRQNDSFFYYSTRDCTV